MEQLVIRPLAWNTLKDIDEVEPIGERDSRCLEEIRQVLSKYDNLDRFGVALLHSHFVLSEDEMLLETTDVSKREHWVRPVKKAYLKEVGLEPQTTVLRFDEESWSQNCGCLRDKHGHTGRHT